MLHNQNTSFLCVPRYYSSPLGIVFANTTFMKVKTTVILIIDSDDDNSLELKEALLNNGFDVLETLNVIHNNVERPEGYDSASALICQFRHVKNIYLDAIANWVQTKPCPVIIFTNDDNSDAIEKSVKIGVNAYIVDGFNSQRIKPIIEVAINRFKNFQSITEELHKTRQQLNDRKLIDKAKGILMKSKNMDEQQAYNSIRKMAMDKSKSMSDIARSIIDVMEIML
ncbi:MAG: ANTAR domain-containing protein [Gammaproteobacteria bacterium]|nr:ANTAR domain-containing protein [Gammaproteobacteria bacterium]